MGVLKGDARLACVDLSNYAGRKNEITKQLMEAATTVGCGIVVVSSKILAEAPSSFRELVPKSLQPQKVGIPAGSST